MHRAHPRFALLAIALATACGPAAGEQPAPTAPTATPVAAPALADTATVAAEPAAAAGTWSLIDVVPQDAAFVARLDGKSLRAAPIYQSLMSAMRAKGAGELLDKLAQQCGFSVPEAVDEVVVSGSLASEADVLVVARVQPQGDAALKCVAQLAHGDPSQAGGKSGIRLPGQRVAISTEAPGGPVLVAGREEMVQAAVKWIGAKKHGSSPLLGRLDRSPPVFLSAFATPPPGLGVRGVKVSIEADGSHLASKALLETPSPDEAKQFAGQAQQGLKQAAVELDAMDVPAETKKQLKTYLSGVSVRADGPAVELQFGVKGDVAQQSAFVGTMAALAEAGVSRYLGRAKSSEAKMTVSAIARDLASYMEMERPGAGGKVARATRLPASAPRTPAKVPKGVPESVTEKTWSHPTWQAIKFSMTGQTRYSYEIVTAGDGKSAVVRATGDLDGDGKFSSFERKITIGKDGNITLSPDVAVKDELE